MVSEKPDNRGELTLRMQRLTDLERRMAISASSNGIGFERMSDRAKQVQLRGAYRSGGAE